ncbi:MAG TPA: lactate racemase domain-containing protein, partial [Holophaga sp.]|nr:lactate racemase domain-containing protein [Holophaga sp.]
TMLGPEIPARIAVVNHRATDTASLANLGKTPLGVPVILNKLAVAADLRIAIGSIEPHKMAGYSGGTKTLAVGVAGRDTIAFTHSREVSEHPSSRLGAVRENRFRLCLDEVAAVAGLEFIVNVVQSPQGELASVVAGHPQRAFERGVTIAGTQAEVAIEAPADLVVAIPGPPKEQNLYQSSRALNSVVFGPQPVLVQGGDLIVPASCEDGFGDTGLLDALAAFASPQELVAACRRDGFPPGGPMVAYKLATIMSLGDIWYTDCALDSGLLRRMHLRSAPTVQEAIQCIQELKRPQRVLILPYATTTIPRLGQRHQAG